MTSGKGPGSELLPIPFLERRTGAHKRGDPQQIAQLARGLHSIETICSNGIHMYEPAAKISSLAPIRGSASTSDSNGCPFSVPANCRAGCDCRRDGFD